MVGKLKIIQREVDSKEYQKNPVNEFQDKATDCNTAVVLAGSNASKLILDDWHQCSKLQDHGDMAMHKKVLYNDGKILIHSLAGILKTV